MVKLNLKPASGYLLIKPLEAETKTASGIYLPDTASEKPQKGEVVAVGGVVFDNGHEVKPPAKIGDVVFYKKWGGNEVKINAKEYLFVKFEDILAIES